MAFLSADGVWMNAGIRRRILIHTYIQHLLQPEAVFLLKMHKKHLVTGLHPGPQGELPALLQTPSWI